MFSSSPLLFSWSSNFTSACRISWKVIPATIGMVVLPEPHLSSQVRQMQILPSAFYYLYYIRAFPLYRYGGRVTVAHKIPSTTSGGEERRCPLVTEDPLRSLQLSSFAQPCCLLVFSFCRAQCYIGATWLIKKKVLSPIQKKILNEDT